MIYICTWETKTAVGTLETDGRTHAEAERRARKILREGYGILPKSIVAEPCRLGPIQKGMAK